MPRMTWAPLRAFVPASLDNVLVGAALILGSIVRLIPILGSDFPINDGGLFAAMIDDLVRHGPNLPRAVDYNGGDIPFAYPPVGLYLGAGFVALGFPTLEVLRFVPVILSVLTIPAWFLLARDLVGPRLGAVAALVFALLPRSYEWLIAGGGITRALGMLLALLALWLALRYLRGSSQWIGVGAGVLLGLATLSHLEAGVFAAASVVLLAFVVRARGSRVLAVGGIAVVVVAPWLVFVLATHGLEPLTSAAGSRLYRYLPITLRVLELRFTQEAYLALGAILGAVGLFVAATSRRAWILIWCISIIVVIPGAAPTYIMIPWSLAAAIAAVEFVVPRISVRWRPRVLVPALAIMFLASVWSSHLESSALVSVPADVRAAMSRIASETPAGSRAIVVTGSAWASDAVAEWYPYLTGDPSVATVQGHEFAGDWDETRDASIELAACAHRDFSCVEELVRVHWPDAQMVFIPKGPVPGARDQDCCAALRESAREMRPLLYDEEGATIVLVGP
jgi:4-amino-4-deoxy-L-arabinose transferase-like glycosyltransferase